MWVAEKLDWEGLILNNKLTQYSTVLPEMLTDVLLAKKFLAFYGTQRFITTFTSARYLSLP
jgi:hypothetical protein